jgi:hypothetical protein
MISALRVNSCAIKVMNCRDGLDCFLGGSPEEEVAPARPERRGRLPPWQVLKCRAAEMYIYTAAVPRRQFEQPVTAGRKVAWGA